MNSTYERTVHIHVLSFFIAENSVSRTQWNVFYDCKERAKELKQ